MTSSTDALIETASALIVVGAASKMLDKNKYKQRKSKIKGSKKVKW